MSEVTALIPNWNGAAQLEPLLESLHQQTTPVHKVLIVDGGSTDNSVQIGRAFGCDVVQLPRNLGFSKAVNVGLQYVQTPFVAILNNDVRLEQNWLAELLGALEAHPHCFLVSGKIWSSTGTGQAVLDGAFDALSRGGCAWRAGHLCRESAVWNTPRYTTFLPFTAVLIRRNLFEQAGLLDETFESYLEDVEFCLRAALQGFEGLYWPKAECWHAGSATLGRWHPRVVQAISRNQVLLVAKHYPASCLKSYWRQILMAQLLWGLVAARHGRLASWIRGKLQGLRLAGRVREGYPQRQSTQVASRLKEILEASEATLREIQQGIGFDFYWRLYFALT